MYNDVGVSSYSADDSGLPIRKDLKSTDNQRVDQSKLNKIISIFNTLGIKTTAEFTNFTETFFKKIVRTEGVLNKNMSEAEFDKILIQTVKLLNKESDQVSVTLNQESMNQLHYLLNDWKKEPNSIDPTKVQKQHDPFTSQEDDLDRVTSAYDKLIHSQEKLKETTLQLSNIITNSEDSVCPAIIIGAGDAGVTQWLENYKPQHGKLNESLEQGLMPEALIIGETMGSWKIDYTLAQPQSLLERNNAEANPSDYMSTKTYQKNTYVNARHLYQANVVNLASTEAPLLQGTRVLEIGKRENHIDDWKHPECAFRVTVVLPVNITKTIYTDKIDLSTGLGVARNLFPGNYIDTKTYNELSTFNGEYTPIVDGNQFMLSTSEEKSEKPRKILVYGGGGNATACFRKGFFGKDQEGLEFTEENQKNNVRWISKSGFEMAGYGTMAKNAIKHGKEVNAIYSAEIRTITKDPEKGNLKVQIALTTSSYEGKEIDNTQGLIEVPGETDATEQLYEIECDQLVYAIGQDASPMAKLTAEFKEDLVLAKSPNGGIPIGLKTEDNKIHVLGAAAVALSSEKREGPRYSSLLREWILKEQIAADAEWPGVLPPSREGIKALAAENQKVPSEVNVNFTGSKDIANFLKDAGVQSDKIQPFINSLLEHRKTNAWGISRDMLTDMLAKFQIDDKVKVIKHSFLKRIDEGEKRVSNT